MRVGFLLFAHPPGRPLATHQHPFAGGSQESRGTENLDTAGLSLNDLVSPLDAGAALVAGVRAACGEGGDPNSGPKERPPPLGFETVKVWAVQSSQVHAGRHRPLRGTGEGGLGEAATSSVAELDGASPRRVTKVSLPARCRRLAGRPLRPARCPGVCLARQAPQSPGP